MFGYVTADHSALTEEQKQRYQGFYCGLCKMIGKQYGSVQRLSLSYDLTFLALLLSSLYEPEETSERGVCLMHPFKNQVYYQTKATEYAAAMSIALSYHKSRDDWSDDRKLPSLLLSTLYRSHTEFISSVFPRQWLAMEACMNALSSLEHSNTQDPDAGAAAFAGLMEELFVWKQDRWEPQLRNLGSNLGRFIYLMDALLDLPSDLQKNRYNPLAGRAAESDSELKENCTAVFHILLGECSNAFEQLPLIQDADLLRNILYSGVWAKYRAHYSRIEQEAKHV